MAFTLTSPAFREGDEIPRKFTCDGDDLSPSLGWSNPPDNTRSFALIMDDPDAPRGTFTHWLLHDVPGDARKLGEGVRSGTSLKNDFGRPGYGGPCPPPGKPHRYFFTLYALDAPSLRLGGSTRKDLEEAMKAHTLGTAKLMGRYARGK